MLLVITCVSTVVGDTHTPTGTKNIYVTIARRKAIWHQFAGKREKEGNESGRHEQTNVVMQEQAEPPAKLSSWRKRRTNPRGGEAWVSTD